MNPFTPRLAQDGCAPEGILIVDDNEAIRNLLEMFCRTQNLRCWLARGGAEALQIYQEHGREIGMILLDVQMPGMDGPHTLLRLRALGADAVCGFMTGDPGAYTHDDLISIGGCGVLEKPFSLNRFVRFVEEIFAQV